MGNMLTRITDCQRQMKNMFNVFEGITPRVLILGLDGAGKTTLLYSAKLDDFIYAIAPPTGVIIEHVTPRRGATIQLFDFPGSKLTRHLWHNWFQSTEAVIFVVDSADKVRIDEAKFELHDLLTSRWLRKVPLIVVANKQDLPESMPEDEVVNELDLHSISNRDWCIFGVSAKKKQGVMKIFDEAVERIKAYRHYKSSLTEKLPDKNSIKDKDTKKDATKDGGPVFTSIEDHDAMNEKIPSLFENLNKKSTDSETEELKVEAGDKLTDSGLSSRESVMYDQLNDNNEMNEHPGIEKPDSIKDDGSDNSDTVPSNDSGNEEDVMIERAEEREAINAGATINNCNDSDLNGGSLTNSSRSEEHSGEDSDDVTIESSDTDLSNDKSNDVHVLNNGKNQESYLDDIDQEMSAETQTGTKNESDEDHIEETVAKIKTKHNIELDNDIKTESKIETQNEIEVGTDTHDEGLRKKELITDLDVSTDSESNTSYDRDTVLEDNQV